MRTLTAGNTAGPGCHDFEDDFYSLGGRGAQHIHVGRESVRMVETTIWRGHSVFLWGEKRRKTGGKKEKGLQLHSVGRAATAPRISISCNLKTVGVGGVAVVLRLFLYASPVRQCPSQQSFYGS